MRVNCGCHCIKCGSVNLESHKIGKTEPDGYFDMHHTCKECNTHFDHLEGETFAACDRCGFNTRLSLQE